MWDGDVWVTASVSKMENHLLTVKVTEEMGMMTIIWSAWEMYLEGKNAHLSHDVMIYTSLLNRLIEPVQMKAVPRACLFFFPLVFLHV